LYRAVGPLDVLAKPVYAALLGPDAHTTDPEAYNLVADAFRCPDRRGMYVAMRSAMLGRQDLTETIRALTTRTLIATGTDDSLWTPDQARSAAAQMPNATAAILPGAGHVAPLLHSADALAMLLTGFWQEARVAAS
jgi:pimeloyl-ACP methyl ester carboxylesterase